MRIVMLTDDVQIDRRILQEAASMMAEGHEVILLASASAGLPGYSIMDGVKVERFSETPTGMFEKVAIEVHGFALRLINAASATLQRYAAIFAHAPFRLLIWIVSLLHRGWIKFANFALTLVPAVCNRLSSGATRLVEKGVRFGAGLRKAIVWSSTKLSRGFYLSAVAANWLHSRLCLLLTRVSAFCQRILVTIAWRMCWLAAVLSNKLLSLVLYGIRRLRRIPLRDRQLAARAAYFDPDILHAHDLPQLRAGVLAAEELKVPLIYDAHELYPEINTLTAAQQKRLGAIEARYIRRCNVVITVNPHLAAEFARRYGIDEPKVILNAIDPPADLFAARRNRIREEFGLCERDKILLFQGWMSPTRGLQNLVHAMASVPTDVHLLFMGYGEMQPELERIAASAGIAQRIHFKAAVPQSELLYWTASADAGVIPYQPVDLNHLLCSPNKLFEFIQARLPIIANDLPYLRDVVAAGELGLVVDINEVPRLAAAITEMFDESLGGARRFAANLERAQSRYSWKAQENALKDIYNRVAEKRAENVARIATAGLRN